MSLITTLHIIPLQLTLQPDLTVTLICDDPRASLDPSTGILTISLVRDPANPRPGLEGVRLVVNELPPHNCTTFQTSMFTGPPGMPLVPWTREGTLMSSLPIPVGVTIQVWSTVLAIPENPAAAKAYQGRRIVKIDSKGAGDLPILSG